MTGKDVDNIMDAAIEYQSPMGKVIVATKPHVKKEAARQAKKVSIPYGEGNRTTLCVVFK